MTSIVGLVCSDGIVIGADSAATFASAQGRTIEQPYDKKVEIISDRLIIAGTGAIGHSQRFLDTVKKLHDDERIFQSESAVDIGRKMAAAATVDFASTNSPRNKFAAFVAFPAKRTPHLVEFDIDGFQPELKTPDMWFVSAGSGQAITDSFLALFKSVFWADGPPTVRGGIFTAYWALKHACDVNTGGISEPIKIATLTSPRGQPCAKLLSDDELEEHKAAVAAASQHFASYKDILDGNVDAPAVPER